MFQIAKLTFTMLFRRKLWRLGAFVAILIPAIYVLGFQGFARYSVPIATLSHPVGLANFMAMIIAVFLAVTLISEDKRRGFTELMMTKPVAPWQYLAGKMAGSLAMLGLIWAGIGTVLIASNIFLQNGATAHLVFTLAFAYLGQVLVFCLGVLLSQWLSPLVAGILVLLLHDRVFYSLTMNIDQYSGSESVRLVSQWFLKIIYYLVPQVSEFALWGTSNFFYLIDPVRCAMAAFYAVVYTLLLFAVSVIVFERSKW